MSTNEKAFSNQHIIDCLNREFGIITTSLEMLPLGADINASVYKAQTLDNQSYFVKLKYGQHHDFGALLTKHLYEAGIHHVITPINTIQGKATLLMDGFTLIVYPFIEGQDGFKQNLSQKQWIELGKTLRKVHEALIPLSLKDKIRRENFSAHWRNSVESIISHVQTNPSSSDDIKREMLSFFKQNHTVIRNLVDTAHHLAHKLKSQSHRCVLCHSDIHGGNVLIDKRDNIYIIDWDEPILAPKERDLMFIGGGVANVWNKPDEVALFYQGYGNEEINNELLAYYRHERIVEDIAVYAQELLLNARDNQDRAVLFKHFLDMFDPNGVVEIAFKTYNSMGN
ncbi:MAG: phosphotransferase [Candidatus Berkiella sp.]